MDAGAKEDLQGRNQKLFIVKALVSGAVDRAKVAREVGVNVNTVYNIIGNLTRLGYVLAIHQKKKRVGFPASTISTTTGLTHGRTKKEGSNVRSKVRLTGDSGRDEADDELSRELDAFARGEKNLTDEEISLIVDEVRAKKGLPRE